LLILCLVNTLLHRSFDSSKDCYNIFFIDGEAVSEEENSGDEENLDALKEDGETVVTGKRKKKSPKKKGAVDGRYMI